MSEITKKIQESFFLRELESADITWTSLVAALDANQRSDIAGYASNQDWAGLIGVIKMELISRWRAAAKAKADVFIAQDVYTRAEVNQIIEME